MRQSAPVRHTERGLGGREWPWIFGTLIVMSLVTGVVGVFVFGQLENAKERVAEDSEQGMRATIEVLGVYPVEADEPCHLIEIRVVGSRERIDLGSFTQVVDGQPRDNWQVPYDEKLLNKDGTKVLVEVGDGIEDEQLWKGDVRAAFFLHYLDVGRPLETPLGPVSMPTPEPRPKRLSFIEYEPPG